MKLNPFERLNIQAAIIASVFNIINLYSALIFQSVCRCKVMFQAAIMRIFRAYEKYSSAQRNVLCSLSAFIYALNINEFEVSVDVEKAFPKKGEKFEASNVQATTTMRARSLVREKSSRCVGTRAMNGIDACSLRWKQFVSRRQSRVAKALYAPRRYNVGVYKVYVTFTRARIHVGMHVYDTEETKLGRGEVGRGWRGVLRGLGVTREERRGRIGASEAEASLLGDYGSLILIQRSELHAKRKSRPLESGGYHTENVWSRRHHRRCCCCCCYSPLLVMSVLRVG